MVDLAGKKTENQNCFFITAPYAKHNRYLRHKNAGVETRKKMPLDHPEFVIYRIG